MKVAGRVALGSGLIFAVLLAVLLYDLSLVRRLARANERISAVNLRATMISLEQSRLLNQIDEFTRKRSVTGDAAYAVKLSELERLFAERLAELGGLALTPAERRAAESVGGLWEELTALGPVEVPEGRGTAEGEAPAADAREGAAGGGAADAEGIEQREGLAVVRLGRKLDLLDSLHRQTAALTEATRQAARDEAARAVEVGRRAERFSWLAALGALLLGLPVLWLTVRSIRRPLTRLTAGTRVVAGGDFSVELDASGDDEFARLAASFNQMVRRLQQLDDVKKDFLSHLSHELKTPLVAMQETNELLLEGLPGPLTAKQRRLLELNRQSSTRLSGMIEKLLDLARMEAESLHYEFRGCDLVDLARTGTAVFEARARERGVELSVLAPPDPIAVRCDRDRMLQVIENLIENAVKFSPRGGAVEVALRPPEGTASLTGLMRARRRRAILEVSDRGPGVPDADKARIFEKFHQIAGDGRVRSGVGLGLAICREIVAAHHGEIEVRDRSGGGSTFSVRLPAAAETPPEDTTREAARRKSPKATRKAEVAGPAALACALLLAAGCAGLRGPGDRSFEAGDYERAAAAYVETAQRGGSPNRAAHALFRLAVIHALPDSPLPDPERAAALLRRLLERHPGSRHAAEAGLLLALLEERAALAGALAEKTELLASMTRELAAARSEAERVEGEAVSRRDDLERLTRQIGSLKTEIGRLAEAVAQRERELEQLKAIDLATPP